MQFEKCRTGLRVNVTRFIGLTNHDHNLITPSLIKNRKFSGSEPCTIIAKVPSCDDAWLVEFTILKLNENGKPFPVKYQAVFTSGELEEAMPLPFDPLPFDNSLMKWLGEYKKND